MESTTHPTNSNTDSGSSIPSPKSELLIPFRKISNSEATDAATCERLYYNAYIRGGQGLAPKKLRGPLAIGGVGHEALEIYFKARKDGVSHPEAVNKSIQHMTKMVADLDNCIYDLEAILKARICVDRYFQHYGDHPNWTILRVEELYEMQIPNQPFSIPMRLDLLVHDKSTGKILLVDHKFTYDWWKPRKFNLRGQFYKYVAILRHNGVHVDAVVINQLRYREMKSTDPADYNQRYTQDNFTNFKMKRILKDHVAISKWIMKFRELSDEEQNEKAKFLLVDPICKYCAFGSLCEAELEGTFVDVMLKTDFRKNEYGYNHVPLSLEDL